MLATAKLHLFSHGRRLDGRRRAASPRAASSTALETSLKTALRTRQIGVDEACTVRELKQKYADALKMSEHIWFTRDGVCIHARRPSANAKADEKGGTDALRLGEEVVCTHMMMLKGGKGATTCFKVRHTSRW